MDVQNDVIPEQGANGNGSGAAMQDLLSALNAAMQNGALLISSALRNPTWHHDLLLCVLVNPIVSCRMDSGSMRSLNLAGMLLYAWLLVLQRLLRCLKQDWSVLRGRQCLQVLRREWLREQALMTSSPTGVRRLYRSLAASWLLDCVPANLQETARLDIVQ